MKKLICILLSLICIIGVIPFTNINAEQLNNEQEKTIDYIFMIDEKEYTRQTVKNGDILVKPNDPVLNIESEENKEQNEQPQFVGWFIDDYQLFVTDANEDGIIDDEIVFVTDESTNITVVAKFTTDFNIFEEVVDTEEINENDTTELTTDEVQETNNIDIVDDQKQNNESAIETDNKEDTEINDEVDEVKSDNDFKTEDENEITIDNPNDEIEPEFYEEDWPEGTGYIKNSNNGLLKAAGDYYPSTPVHNADSRKYIQINRSGTWDHFSWTQGTSGDDRNPQCPEHVINSDGTWDSTHKSGVGYCLNNKKDSPSGNTAYTRNSSNLTTDQKEKGILAILQHGYPNTTISGLDAKVARHATQMAMRVWIFTTNWNNLSGDAPYKRYNLTRFGIDITSSDYNTPEKMQSKIVKYLFQYDDGAALKNNNDQTVGSNDYKLQYYIAQLLVYAVKGDIKAYSSFDISPKGTTSDRVILNWNETNQRYEATFTFSGNYTDWVKPTDGQTFKYLKNGNKLTVYTTQPDKSGTLTIDGWSNYTGFIISQKSGNTYQPIAALEEQDFNVTIYFKSAANDSEMYVVKTSTDTDSRLLEKYPLTGAEFTAYTTQEAANTANNNLINGRPAGTAGIAKDKNGNNIVLTVKKVDNQFKTDSVKVDAGTYYFIETKAPNNYTRSTEVKSLTVAAGETKSVSFADRLPRAYLYVIKKGANNQILTQFPLTGAQFKVYTNENCTTEAKDIYGDSILLTAGADGKTNKVTLKVGTTYYIKEYKAPNGYELSDQKETLTLTVNDDEQTTYFEFTDELITGELFVKKIVNGSSTYSPIDIKFTVYKDAECTTVAKMIDSSGELKNAVLTIVRKESGKDYWVSDNITLPKGTYYVKEDELSSDSPFIIDTSSLSITITKDTTKSVTFTNEVKTGSIYIRKWVSGSTAYSPIGCKFTIYNQDGTIAKDINGNNAVLEITKEVGDHYESNPITLYVGSYYVKETDAVDPFILSTERKDFDIEYNKTIPEDFTNDIQGGDCTIIKTVTQNNLIEKFPIIGTTFTIYTSEEAANTAYNNVKNGLEAGTKGIAKDIDGNNVILVVNKVDNQYRTNTATLLPGTYWIVETVVMPHYKMIEVQSFTLENKEDKVLEFINELQVGKGKVKKIW